MLFYGPTVFHDFKHYSDWFSWQIFIGTVFHNVFKESCYSKVVTPFFAWNLIGLGHKLAMGCLSVSSITPKFLHKGLTGTTFVSKYWYFNALIYLYLSLLLFVAVGKESRTELFIYCHSSYYPELLYAILYLWLLAAIVDRNITSIILLCGNASVCGFCCVRVHNVPIIKTLSPWFSVLASKQ